MEAEWVAAVAGVVTGVATIALAWIAYYQLSELRKQLEVQGARDKQWRTIEACENYTYDPVLRQAKDRIWEARDRGRAPLIHDTHAVRKDAIVILNYLDALGIGVRQGVYLEEIVFDHLEHIVRDLVRNILRGGWGQFNIPETELGGLMYLYDRLAERQAPRHTATR
ncbi:MAG TPA: hypothetical protein VL358_10890 [Caulobacteraceae bacterium]|jgi:hypothetical protein|nr:hypothetical protein [Caulobacteraceae bacterium]